MIAYNEKKHKILSLLYQLRTLTYTEIYENVFALENLKFSYCDKLLKQMISEDVIYKEGYYKESSFYGIKQKGINILKTLGLIDVGSRGTISIPLLLPAHKININPKLSAHQTSLNHFVLEWAKKDKNFIYYDEKYIASIFSGVRPDGIIIKEDTMYFLEMDMNTERLKALNEKWQHYNAFIRSKEYYELDKKILVVFILGGDALNTSKRVEHLRSQILLNFHSTLSNDFNFIIGTEEEVFRYINASNKPLIENAFKRSGYRIGRGAFSNDSLNGYDFDFYTCLVSADGKLISKGGEAEEFIIDDVTDGNMYSLYKLESYSSITTSFKYRHKRDIKYLMVLGSEGEAMEVCRQTGVFNTNIYFTTLERLKTQTLHSAIFQIDKTGSKWHCSEECISIRVDEGKLEQL